MTYYLNEIREEGSRRKHSRNAVGKARADVATILETLGAVPCDVQVDVTARAAASGLEKMLWHRRALEAMEKSTSHLGEGDTLYIQFPVISHSVFTGGLLRRLTKKGIRVVLIIHDLETLRHAKESGHLPAKLRYRAEELQALRYCDCMIVHNDAMKRMLAERGILEEKLVSLGLFDYLLSDEVPFDQSSFRQDGNVVVAGNLAREKSGYLYELPENMGWNLYGVGYNGEERPNINYKGSYPPEELPQKLEGSFGLVWDGPSAETCTSIYGDYLRINNPHKCSLYLAAGLPVIIWKEAALAKFVEENGIGITVASLYEIKDTVCRLTEEQYNKMKENCHRIGLRVRQGCYLREALSKR